MRVNEKLWSKDSRRYKKLHLIRCKNSFTRYGHNPLKKMTLTTVKGSVEYNYKDGVKFTSPHMLSFPVHLYEKLV